MSLPNSSQVLVVGAGPVGLVAAISLAQRGIQVAIADASGLENRNGSRAAVIHSNTLEVLDNIGMTELIIAHGIKTQEIIFRGGNEKLMAVNLNLLRDKTPYPFSLLISQHQVEALLRKKLTELGIQLFSHRAVTGYTQVPGSDGLNVEFEDGSKVQTRYLIGTDGARSTVRKLANIPFSDPFTGVAYDEPADSRLYMVLADVVFKYPLPPAMSEDKFDAHLDNFFFSIPLPSTDPSYPGIMWRIGFATPSQGREVTVPRNPSLEYLQAELDRRNPMPERIVIDHVMTSSRYRVRDALAREYFTKIENDGHPGYILLAGDAAHVHSPVGGQGMNLGICDAYDLAQAIHAHLDGTDDALQKYSDKRHKIGHRVVRLTRNLTFIVSSGVGWRRIVRNTLMRILGIIPWFRRAIVWRVSGLANKE